MERLAIDGGTPVRQTPWVSEFQGSEAIGEGERQRVMNVLDKKRVFRYLAEGYDQSEAKLLEEEYRKLTGSRFALAVNSGTSALICALVGAGVGPGDQVIIPAYTFVATAAAVLAVNAVPILVEIDDSLTIDVRHLSSVINERTRAIVAVHMRGISCDMDPILELAAKQGIAVIEDAAQANGGSYGGKPLGALGKVGCFSLQQYKVITSGEGGMLVTNDELVWQRAAVYHDCGLNPFKFHQLQIPAFAGQNYRITELQAALCLGQVSRLRPIVAKMQATKQQILRRLASVPGIEFSPVFGSERDIGVSLVIYLKGQGQAEQFARAVSAEGIPAHQIYSPNKPDLHIYRYWPFLMEKRDAWGGSHPWNLLNHQDISYWPDMCPQTLDLLGRAVQIRLNQYVQEADIEDLVKAVTKVATNLLE